MKTGIIGAMTEEVASLKKELTDAKTAAIAGMEFCEGRLDGAEVVIVKCGIGKVNAGTCTQLLIHVFGVDRIINTGVAGSLDAAIDIGDIVVSTDAVQHDFDLTPLGFAPGELEGIGSPSLPADPDMRARAVEAVRKCAEGGAIAQVCCQNKTPFVIIRAISDKADGSAEMNFTEFEHAAAIRCAAITSYMVSH